MILEANVKIKLYLDENKITKEYDENEVLSVFSKDIEELLKDELKDEEIITKEIKCTAKLKKNKN